MRSAIAICMLAAGLLLAGCAQEEPAQEAPDEEQTTVVVPAPDRDVERDQAAFGWLATAGPPGPGLSIGVAYATLADIEVPADTKQLTVNATWTCPLPACLVTVALWDPGTDVLSVLAGSPREQASSDGLATFTIDSPEEGTWTVTAHPDGASAELDGVFAWELHS